MASFLEAYGYLQRLSQLQHNDDVNSRPVEYILTPKATALTEKIISTVSVFISYRRQISSLQALMLSYWLSSYGIENFLDINGITQGSNLHPQIENAIHTRTHFICILGTEEENTIDSRYVQQEIKYAMTQYKKCIPFFQHNWTKPAPAMLEEYSQEVQDFIDLPGQPVVTTETGGHLANAYADALNRLLPALNISQLS